MTISPARPDDLAAAFALLYGPAATNGHFAHAFQLVARGELNPADLLVAQAGGTPIGAVFCQRLPGSIAVIWPPGANGNDRAVEDVLTAAALEHVAGVKVVQAFLPPEEARRAEPLLRAGFRRVARVRQMDRPPGPPLPRSGGEGLGVRGLRSLGQNAASSGRGPQPPSPRPSPTEAGGEGERQPLPVSLVPYANTDPADFERTLLRAHDDSLDCPELHGVRTPDEVLAGYRDCAPDLSGWWLARVGDESVGAVILGPGELSFVGVVPERRGQGIGRALVEAAVSWHAELSLIVDERNAPAIALYRSLGFQTVGSRDVYLLLR
jgi:ribosomal protein S18 acetylase RimI-like enzyme